MVSPTSNAPGQVADPVLFSATTPSGSTDSSDSFAQQLVSALESYLGQQGSGSQLNLNIQPSQGQESGTGQYVVTITEPAASSASTASATSPASPPIAGPTPATPVDGPAFSALSFSSDLQEFSRGWSVLTPQQMAFQLANAGAGGGDPSATVPGTSLTFGQLNQVQQLAYQYAADYGTGGLSMQDFLTQNTGPQAAWNQSYNQTQLDPAVQAAVDTSYQVSAGGVPMPIQAPNEYGTIHADSGNADNLPNPAMIQYLPQDQQAAAYAAVAAEGTYGDTIAAAASAYAST